MPPALLHLDADAFFASVEQASDPRLRGRPVAVGGEKRGIVASASYEARKFGIYTPMPTVLARKLCPKLVLLPGDFEKYERFSQWMFSYAYDFTPDVEVASIDEGYFDLGGVRQSPRKVARIIREAIRQSLKITVSEGLGTNKLVSQVASKLNKPAAFLEVPAGREAGFLEPLPNRWLPGVGPKLAARLNAAGLARVGQIAVTPPDLLEVLVGGGALTLHRFARGLDDRPVIPTREPAKSFGQQETFAEDITDEEYAEAVLRRMADHLMAKVRAEGKCIRTLTVKVRYNDMAEDQCGESLLEPTDVETDLYGRIHGLMRNAWKRRVSLRLVSLRLSNLYDGRFTGQLALEPADRRSAASHRLIQAVDELREKYGRGIVIRGHDFRLREHPHYCSSRGNEALTGKTEHRTSKPEPGRPIELRTSNIRLSATQGGIANDVQRSTTEAQRPTFNVQRSTFNRIGGGNKGQTTTIIPLAVRSYYSFLNSTLSIDDIVGLAKRQGLPAVALADVGNLHGAVEFWLKARAAGLQPVLGAELRVAGRPALLYVENRQGYANLCRLLSEPDAGFRETSAEENESELKRVPDISLKQLADFTGGLIAAGGDPQLADLFPKRFYRAVHSPDEIERLDRVLPETPVAAVLPAHYAAPADRWKFDVVQAIRTRTLLKQAHPGKLAGGQHHFRAPSEWRALFGQYPRALQAGAEIAERCRGFEFPLGKPQFPAYLPPDGSAPREFLRRLVLEGLRRRYRERAKRLRPQIEEELGIIAEVGYEEYFLVVWDLLQECRRHGIEWLTRGSAADSLVCYCLGISDVCPIRFDLYFRRFLNKDRMALNKLPDIDVDFPHDRKDNVIDLMFAKYGPRHCAVVGVFSTFKARGAVGDVGKVLGMSEHQVRRFTEHFPWGRAKDLLQVLGESQECRDLPLNEEPYRTALQMAEFLDGFPRYPKMHPCGVVLSRQPMHELTPTFRANKGYPTTHFDMDAVEAIGLVKIDVLAQGGLAVMRDARVDIERRTSNVEHRTSNAQHPTFNGPTWAWKKHSTSNVQRSTANLQQRSWDDPAVWEMIAGGGARAVHHIESPAMIGLCRQCNVREIDGLVAIVSVIRPGAANEHKKLRFTRRYQGLEPVTYPHPSLEPCLKSTFGLVVYEEHILQICEAFAGLPPGRADVLRRALGKEKIEIIREIGAEFAAAARWRGHPDELIAEVWNLVTGFAGYAFCKAHSTAYAVEAYQSAWLKKYYPTEFMAAVLTNGKGFYDPMVYVLECHRLGIRLLPPWVNEPGPEFKPYPCSCSSRGNEALIKGVERRTSNVEHPTSNIQRPTSNEEQRTARSGDAATSAPTIRVPVTRIKGLGEKTLERLLAERQRGEFVSLRDFYARVGPLPEEMELLIRAGAFDGFGLSRTAQFWEAQLLRRAFGPGPHGAQGQGWLIPPPGAERLGEAPLEEPTRRQRLEWEGELLGFPASGHPLELFDHIAWDTYCPVARLGEFCGQEVVACGLIIEQRMFHQATGEPMKFLTLADWTGIVETELFASTYRSYGLATVRYPVLEVTATVEPFENRRGFTLRIHRAGKPRTRQ